MAATAGASIKITTVAATNDFTFDPRMLSFMMYGAGATDAIESLASGTDWIVGTNRSPLIQNPDLANRAVTVTVGTVTFWENLGLGA